MNELSPFDVLVDGRRLRVHPAGAGDTVADLAAALGATAAAGALVIDGRVRPGRTPLATSGLRHGSRVSVPGEEPPAGAPGIVVTVEAGPAAGSRHHLRVGRHVVGRAHDVAISVDDPAMAPHHLLIDVGAVGEIALTQLAGRVGVRRLGERDGDVCRVVVGASLLRLEPTAGQRRSSSATSGPVVWHRPTRSIEREPALEALPTVPGGASPAGPVRPGGFAGAVTGLVASALVATVTGQVLFLLMGVIGALAAVAGTSWPWIRHVAGRSRHRRAVAEALSRREAARRRNLALLAAHARRRLPDLAEALERVERVDPRLWERRPHHADAAEVVLGPGRLMHELGELDDVPVTVDLAPGTTLGLAGSPVAVRGLARSLVVQRAIAGGPADWRLMVVTEQPADWAWATWLPHAVLVSTDAGAVDAGAVDDGSDGRALLVVVTDPDALVLRTGPVRRLLDGARVASIVLAPARALLPAWCTAIVEVRADATARLVRDPTDPLAAPVALHPAGLGAARAELAAARLAGLVDPECAGAGAALASRVSLLGLLGDRAETSGAIAATWRGADQPVTPLGRAVDGIVDVDLVRDGPHALIAGTTGAGKSELLRSLVLGLAAGTGPDRLVFVLIDYKGGATFDPLVGLPHTVGTVTDLDPGLADRVLRSLEAELRRREALLRSAGATDLPEYRRARPGEALPRLVVVVDEFAALASELAGFLHALVGIAQRGRSLGVHLVLATQRPAGVISDEIRANTQLRLALRVHDRADSMDVLGDPAAAMLPRRRPGRALLRLGPGELVDVQVACTSGPARDARPARLAVTSSGDEPPSADGPSELDVLVERIGRAAALCGVARPHRPWLAPLPAVLDDEAVSGSELQPGGGEGPLLGVLDDPDHQCRRALRWRPGPGHTVVAGELRSGVTSTLVSLARAATASAAPEELHLYVLDGRGDPRLAWLERLPHCGGVVPVADHERSSRLLHRIATEIEGRAVTTGLITPPVVVLVDGIGALRAALDHPGRLDDALLLDRIAADGPAVGVVLVVGTDRPGDLPGPLLARASTRWVLRLGDPAEVGPLGVAASRVPRTGPGRLVDAGTGLEAQLVVPPAAPWSVPGGTGPPQLGVLGDRVLADALPSGRDDGAGGAVLAVGVAHRDLGPALLVVPEGEHVLVLGPARSGRSTTLARLATSWAEAHPGAPVRVVAPRRSPVLDLARARCWTTDGPVADAPGLIVVDDAELVEDLDRPARASVLAASRADSLRGAYGHWVGALRHGRRGVLLGAAADLDADLLGAVLRRPAGHDRTAAALPGRGWLVSDGRADLVQVAVDGP